jgi:hypothetical protein
MKEIRSKPNDAVILNYIVELRGQKIMLDKDLAELYEVEARRLREQVRRNQSRFPQNFMFQLSEQEIEDLLAQKIIPSRSYFGGHLPYAFTEHGILMLSNVLKSEKAIQVSIRIIELFVQMREAFILHSEVRSELIRIREKVNIQDGNIKKIFDCLNAFLRQENERQQIGYKN